MCIRDSRNALKKLSESESQPVVMDEDACAYLAESAGDVYKRQMHWNMRAIRAAGRMSRPFTRPVSSTMPVRHLQHFSMRKARTALLSRPT